MSLEAPHLFLNIWHPYVPRLFPCSIGRQGILWNHCYSLWPTSCEFANGHIPSTIQWPKLITTKSYVVNLYNWPWHTFTIVMKSNIKTFRLCANFKKNQLLPSMEAQQQVQGEGACSWKGPNWLIQKQKIPSNWNIKKLNRLMQSKFQTFLNCNKFWTYIKETNPIKFWSCRF
jgi:hypothetical protein